MPHAAMPSRVAFFVKLFSPLILLLFALLPTQAAYPQGLAPGKIRITYQLNLSGLRFARIVMESEISGDRYLIGLSARSSSIARIFPFKGSTTSAGTLVSGEARPDRYTLTYDIARRDRRIEVGFNNQNATSVSVMPPRGPSIWRQPLLPEHFLNVTDPVSAFIFPLGANPSDGHEACGRVNQVMDGLQRYELKMDFIRTESRPSYETPGQTVPVFVCSFSYRPIVGHNTKDNRDVFFWANNDGVEVWLMPIYSAGVLLPIHGIFPTPYGRAVFQANSLDLTGFARQAVASQ